MHPHQPPAPPGPDEERDEHHQEGAVRTDRPSERDISARMRELGALVGTHRSSADVMGSALSGTAAQRTPGVFTEILIRVVPGGMSTAMRFPR